jgi:hypothetical protein
MLNSSGRSFAPSFGNVVPKEQGLADLLVNSQGVTIEEEMKTLGEVRIAMEFQ